MQVLNKNLILLNGMYGEFLTTSQAINVWFDPTYIKNVKSTEDAFTLNSPVSPEIQVNLNNLDANEYDVGVLRVVIPYKLAHDLVNNYNKGVEIVLAYKNAMLLCMQQNFNPNHFDFYFERPGQRNIYFVELENTAGYELRVFCKRKENK